MTLDRNTLTRIAAQAVLSDPSGTTSAVSALSGHKSVDVRELIAWGTTAADPDVQQVLRKLAHDKSVRVRSQVAHNRATPPEVLAELTHDRNKDVAGLAAGNPSTPRESLADLGTESSVRVQWPIAANPSTPPETLAYLAGSKNRGVRDFVALNPATPMDVRARLLPVRNKQWAKDLKALSQKGKELQFVAFLARRLIWYQLAYCSAAGNLDLVNENFSSDTVRLEFFFRSGDQFAAWEVFLTDPLREQGSAFDVGIFSNGIIDTWPDDLSWPEFEYGEVLPTPMDPEDDDEFERLCSDSWPSEWPSLISDTGYAHWATVDLGRRGWMLRQHFMEALRDFQGTSQIGLVELCAVGAVSPHEDDAIPGDTAAAIAVLSRLRNVGDRHGDSEVAKAARIARNLIEPLLVITPTVSPEILDFVTSDLQCPALHLVRANSSLSDEVRALAALTEGEPLPAGSELTLGLSQPMPVNQRWQGIDQPPHGLHQESSPVAQQHRRALAELLVEILAAVPAPNEDADDGEVEASVGRHKQYLQAAMWLWGDVFVSEDLLDEWVEELTKLRNAVVGEDDDPELVEELAFNSWSMDE